jgi:hypothetical protein
MPKQPTPLQATAVRIHEARETGDIAVEHTHNSEYYTQTLLDGGQLDSRYYTETECDANFQAIGASYSATWDPASIADGSMAEADFTCTGVTLGDFVIPSASIDLAGLALVAHVTAADTITAMLINNSGGAIDLSSMTIRFLVFSH